MTYGASGVAILQRGENMDMIWCMIRDVRQIRRNPFELVKIFWTTKLSDSADFFIILPFISVSMDLVILFCQICFQTQVTWPRSAESPTQEGALSQGGPRSGGKIARP